MKLQILQEDLVKAVSLASRFTSSRSQLPILGNILLSTTKTKMQIASTNLEISVSIQLGAKVDEEGEVCVPSKILSEVITNLPKSTLNINSEKEQLKIEAEGFSTNVLGINSSDFPKVPTSIVGDSFSISKKLLSEKLAKILFATSIDETRPTLTGVLFRFSKKGLVIVATDGFRLSKVELTTQALEKDMDLIIPKLILSEISRVGESENLLINVNEKDKQVIFGVDNIVFSSRIIEGSFPDFERIIPKDSESKVRVDRDEFLRAIKLAAPFSRDNANIVKLKINNDSLLVLSESSQGGKQETKIDAKVDGKAMEISFNYKFIEDFLANIEGSEVQMQFIAPEKAGVFTDGTDKGFLHLIMPVNIQK